MLQNLIPMRLSEVCDISAGHTARQGLKIAAKGGLLAAQLGDVRAGRPIEADALGRYQLAGLSDRFMARPGDVLFRSKGVPSTAAIVSAACHEVIAVFQPLMILRPKTDEVLPDYLTWAINRPAAQRYFRASAQGTTIRSVSKSALEDLPIPVPSLNRQKMIGAAYHLSLREADLLRELADKSELLTSLTLGSGLIASR
ncbi:restriction endonuclease subunit S [Sulfitobacter sp. 1A15299]|uniref:restriction endonuclease subunit S n=1 Tax=Sulfitobacter sp. 1A15299 TaxID=3368598 RepID=UPI00374549BE